MAVRPEVLASRSRVARDQLGGISFRLDPLLTKGGMAAFVHGHPSPRLPCSRAVEESAKRSSLSHPSKFCVGARFGAP
jgi:hypothetical protein